MNGQFVRLKKIKVIKNPHVYTPDIENYIPGSLHDRNVSIPIEYTIVGTLNRPVEVGREIYVNRMMRNGVKSLGLFLTSVVEKIEAKDNGLFVYTHNSVYDMEWLDSKTVEELWK